MNKTVKRKKTQLGKLFSYVLWGVMSGVFCVLFVAMTIASTLVPQLAGAALNLAFGTSFTKTVNDPNAEPTTFFKTDYDFKVNGDNLYKEDSAMIEEAEAAGAVLLWNKTNNAATGAKALPLVGNEKVSLFGHASVDITECGTGSGYVRTYDYGANKAITITAKSAFESRGFTVNSTLWDFYNSGAGKSYKMIDWDKTICKEWREWYVNEVPWNVYGSAVKSSFAEYNDVAVVMLARSGGEYSDLHYNYTSATDTVGNNDKAGAKKENTSADGGYLGLSQEEKDLLKNVTDGTFEKVVVLLNTGNPLQMQDFEPYIDNIDACMWIGQPGSTGINAVVDLLKGKDMDGNGLVPSGRLPDTWAYDNNSAPATVNDGNYQYENSGKYLNTSHGTTSFASKYLVYQEGIYIGYRYYETRYADCVAGEGNADSTAGAKHSTGNWTYNGEVAFPFGYGVSYTTFDYNDFDVKKVGNDYRVSVSVTNTGAYAGREVVQVYLQKPYTSDDKEVGTEKAAIELCGYAKTGVLAANGGNEIVTITVPYSAFKTYDANDYETYIIEEGDYYIAVGTDSHIALNNILAKQGKTPVAEEVLGGAANTKAVKMGAAFAHSVSLARDVRTFAKSEHTGEIIENQLSSGDINKYANRNDEAEGITNSVTYLSRKDWTGTYPKSAAKLKMTRAMANDLRFDIVPDDSDYDMPKYGKFASGSKDGTPDVMKGDLVAYMFIDAPLYPELEKDNDEVFEDGLIYSDHWKRMWDQLLDQMTFEEQAKIVANSYHQINGAVSVALPGSKQENGPVGITKREEAIFSLPERYENEGDGWTWLAYPCAGILAASFDDDIARRVGEHKSEDMLYLGYNGIYGPGVNMHRSPFGGRAFEYPSEDPFLAGYIEAAECKGIESKGCLAYVKHYALNDLETNRVNCGVWSNEQASREIYLRAFEIVFTEGGASATMNSFTRIGTKWNGASYPMMTTILRDEWGYDGVVISDWVTGGSAMSGVDGVMAGTDTFDGNWTEAKFEKYRDNAAVCQALRLATKRVIYNVVRTNVMNGMSIMSRVVPNTPWWLVMLWTITWVLFAIFIISLGMLVAAIILRKLNKIKVYADVDGGATGSDGGDATQASEGVSEPAEHENAEVDTDEAPSKNYDGSDE